MKIECPHCQKDNKIEFAENITCKECKKSFKGFKFSQRRLIPASLILTIGCVGGYKTNNYLEDTRYPVPVEYAIIDSCVNASQYNLSTRQYKKKRDVCLCAFDKTLDQVTYSEYKESNYEFITKFQKNTRKCQ